MHVRLKRIPRGKDFNDWTLCCVLVHTYREKGYEWPKQRYVKHLASYIRVLVTWEA